MFLGETKDGSCEKESIARMYNSRHPGRAVAATIYRYEYSHDVDNG